MTKYSRGCLSSKPWFSIQKYENYFTAKKHLIRLEIIRRHSFRKHCTSLIYCSSSIAPAFSEILATQTQTANIKPCLSTKMKRLRPFTFFPASYPVSSPPQALVFTDYESMLPALGRFLRPNCWRIFLTNQAWIHSQLPSLLHRLK